MPQLIPYAQRVKTILARCVLTFGVVSLIACGATQAFGQRKPLPKPAGGARGFEQYNGDASSRLIAAGSTRGVGDVRKPMAPVEGLAFDTHPMFKWEPAFGAKAYHFTLYEGDVFANKKAPVVYEADVPTTELLYPTKAKALVPGKLYSWRVATPNEARGWDVGPSVSFFLLSGPDAAQLKTALEKNKLTAPKTPAERLRQARIFEEYGVWYDALRIGSELLAQNPNDTYLDTLLDRLDGGHEK